jgi:hypothetical protein
MAHTIPVDDLSPFEDRRTLVRRPAYQAYQILHLGFVVAPLLAGADKFFNRLTTWSDYLAPAVAARLPMSTQAFMMLVGVVEIFAGFLVLVKPKIGAYVVAAWLAGIIANLILARGFYDVALRDLGLMLGALALGRLASVYDTRRHVRA